MATGAFADNAAATTDADRVLRADDWRSAYPSLRERLEGDEVVLLKASRGVALEGILPSLEQDFGAETPSATAEA